MAPLDWKAVREAFDAAVDLPPEERAAFLDRIRDPRVREEVVSLLAASSSDPGVADAVARELHAAAASPEPARIGERLGPYRILEEIGAGGMGTVYLARREDDAFEKLVAIKIVRGARDRPETLERFHAERRILARLDHPGIARILDGGRTGDGLPYLVLEHVSGRPIDAYCRESGLDVAGTVDLFLGVCRAVEYAHRNLIVHRDLKPDNILVDGDGNPHLLDFGIAKLLESDAPALTRTEANPMTPEYASPEQIRGDPITTATDVYALGTLLYELLSGRHPFRDGDTPGHELARAVLETDPKPPSTAVSPDAPGLSAGIEKHRGRLSGDLDTIVLTALRKQPENRYPSVAALAEDLERTRKNLPIRARPATTAYRVRKFVRRNRAAVLAAAAVAVLLTGATAVSVTGYVQAQRAREEAETQRETAAEINAFLRDLFVAASPVGSQSKEDLTAREILDAAAERLETELAGRPSVAGALHHEIGRSYRDLGRFEEAEAQHRLAVDAFRRAGRIGTPGGIRALAGLGSVLTDRESYEEAETVLLECVTLARATNRPPLVAEALSELATTLRGSGDLDGAEGALREALESVDPEDRARDEERLNLTNELGLLYRRQGKLAEAETTMRDALDLAVATYGENHSRTGQVWANLSFILVALDRGEEAVECSRKSLAIYESVFGEDHPQVGTSRFHLADGLSAQGRFDEAVPHYEKALEIFRRHYGEDHGYVGFTVNNLGLGYLKRGEYEKALPLLEQAHRNFVGNYGPEHSYTLVGVHNLATLHARSGDLETAERMCRANLEDRVRVLGPDHVDVARSEILLGEVLTRTGRASEAEDPLRDAVRICAASLPETHSLRVSAGLELGLALVELGARDEAEALLEAAHEAALSGGEEDAETVRRAAEGLRRLREGSPDEEPGRR